MAALLAVDPSHAAVIDTGDVVVSGNDLVIGNTADGSRTVDAVADGPYDSATLGAKPEVSGTLSLDNAAIFTTTAFNAGVPGHAVVQLNDGSALVTGSAVLRSAAITLDGSASWANQGDIAYGVTFYANVLDAPEIVVTDGATVSTNGVRPIESFAHLDLSIRGPGTSWWNDGELRLARTSSFSVLNGATARDNGVLVDGGGYGTRMVVDGVGSTWDTGAFAYTAIEGEGGPGLFITDGGRVTSSSAYLGSSESLVSFRVDGVGSSWSIDGTLESDADGLGLSVTNGGTLESGTARFSRRAKFTNVAISGDGSSWDLRGNLVVETQFSFSSTVVAGGALLVRGDASFTTPQYDCGICQQQQISVRDAGSVFRTEGSLTLQGWRSTDPTERDSSARLVVANFGRAEIWNGVTAFDAGEIELHGGTLSAPLVALQGGSLSGEGVVDASVENGGRVAPGLGGALQVNGSFTQVSGAKLVIVLAGTEAGIDYSLLEVLGSSTLAGAVEVELAEGYSPVPGEVYEILRAGSLFGAFDSYAGLDVGGGVTLVPEYGPTSFVLHAVPEPTTGSLIALGLLVFARRRWAIRKAN